MCQSRGNAPQQNASGPGALRSESEEAVATEAQPGKQANR